MPPNRKGAFDAADSLAALNVSQFVQTSKFQPLTAQPPVASSQQQQQQPSTKPTISSSYKNDAVAPRVPSAAELANRAIVERILADDCLRIQFSPDHIIETLQQQQQQQQQSHAKAAEEEKVEIVHRDNATTSSADDYWDMPTPSASELLTSTTTTTTKGRPTSDAAANYWDWPSMTPQQQNDETIRQILQAEKHRQLFSVDHVEQNLRKEAAALAAKQDKAGNVTNDEAPLVQAHDSYWQWNGEPGEENPTTTSSYDMSASEKATLVESILAAERARQWLSIDHIEQTLTRGRPTTTTMAKEDAVSRTIASHDDYWAGF